METIAKVISLSLLAIFGSAVGVTYLYDPGFFESSPKSDSASNVQNYETEGVNHSSLSHYKERLLEDSQVETQPPKDTNPQPEKLWTDTYDEPESSESSPLQEAKKLADKNSLNVLEEEMDYWYKQYRRSLNQAAQTEKNDAYAKYKLYKEAIEIKRGSL